MSKKKACNILPDKGWMICPLGLSKIFYKKETEKKVFSGQTWRSPLEIVSDPSKDGLDALQMALTLLESWVDVGQSELGQVKSV